MNSILLSIMQPAPDAVVQVLPLVGDTVRAGFPSPAEDFMVQRIDLLRELVKHPQATFLVRVAGISMIEHGIHDGDTLVVDKAVKPRHGHIVIAVVDGEFTVKRLHLVRGRMRLQAGNPTYPDIIPREGQTIEIWGVVTTCIQRFPL
ncbi:translesion error-prone DNA polymerase V autoproteolytic subunit [Paracidovorax citrulli]|uniref:LexA family protein n=2 Tax=Paracidovorax citrulli TaxID=80869 RepID=UPI0003026E69|nr:translesion error-prone DNA polymerase V autoproteolytic subunit [Paracidovorax citrulli]QCX13200.1 translesion error-prone DNA polymerase V autoproteolytic subunit [Paracidovorax citrulli]UMT93522.1 translesion error-prone DNA polymerase V autoproteolytic subunit [Paracidovorax citrulli]